MRTQEDPEVCREAPSPSLSEDTDLLQDCLKATTLASEINSDCYASLSPLLSNTACDEFNDVTTWPCSDHPEDAVLFKSLHFS